MEIRQQNLIETSVYTAELSGRAGNLTRLRTTDDPEDVNLLNVDPEYGFGNLCLTRKDTPPEYSNRLNSPIGIKSWQLQEKCEYASMTGHTENTFTFANPRSAHRIVYTFFDEFFDLTLQGELSDASQCGLAFPTAFMDLRQADDRNYQFNPTTLHCSETRELCYVLLERQRGPDLLFTALSPCAAWRLVYNNDWSIRAVQMLARCDERFDSSGFNAGPVDFKIRISFPRDYDEAMNMVLNYTGLPLVDAPTYYAESGRELPLRIRGPVVKLTAVTPDGGRLELPLRKLSKTLAVSSLPLSQEGFWQIKAENADGNGGDAVFRATLPQLETLRRARAINQPSLGGNAEDSYWVQAFCAYRKRLPPDDRMDGFLYSQLVDIGMQGLPFSGLPAAPPPMVSQEHLQPQLFKDAVIPQLADGLFINAPCPHAHSDNGRNFSPFHLFRRERIQDAFAMIQSFLYAAEAFDNELFYEQATRIGEAYVHDHVEASGRIQCLRDDNLPIDYTTVITPLVSLIELLRAMGKRNDRRAPALREVCLCVAEYLLQRGFEFPTEGAPAHMRWTEDGSIACTALSLFHAYVHLGGDPRFLQRAVEVMDFHRIWTLRGPDVRLHGSSCRFWETMWENDGEGRALNAGHAWNIWQAEALFYQGILTMNAEALLMSWNGFCTNWAKYQADGRTFGAFTPDYLPQRPRRLELCHRYPEHVDPSLAFYVWPRMRETWDRTAALIAPEAVGLPTELGPIVLNGKILIAGSNLTLFPDAPDFAVLAIFGALPETIAVKTTAAAVDIRRNQEAPKRNITILNE